MEYGTSWSNIAKNMCGRTENAIKNYFYSSVRRTQSCRVFDYFVNGAQGLKKKMFDTKEEFGKYYEFDKLNHLGERIV